MHTHRHADRQTDIATYRLNRADSVKMLHNEGQRHNTKAKGQRPLKTQGTWRPSKKLSPMMMTVPPPVVQPSLGEMALMQGMAAAGYRPGYRAE